MFKKTSTKTKHRLSLLTLFEVCILILISSYAWFSDKSTPSINQNNIKVTSAEGLVIKLSPDSAARTEVDLIKIIGDVNKFELKQMSTVDTENYYTIDFGEGLSTVQPKFIKVDKEIDGTYDAKKWGIIDFNFYLQTEDFAKHIYLHKDTSIVGVASKALRVSLTYTVDGISNTLIFGDTKEDGKDYPYTTNAIIKTGPFNYDRIDPSFIKNQDVHLFNEKNGGREINDDDPIDLSKVLLTLDANKLVKINMKLWLEGGDVDCTNKLASSKVDLRIKFGSANVLLDAPNLAPNNALQIITNLTTDMEYTFDEGVNATWMSVIDPKMKFKRGQVVYVRIKEVPGVSPSSYITKVQFN